MKLMTPRTQMLFVFPLAILLLLTSAWAFDSLKCREHAIAGPEQELGKQPPGAQSREPWNLGERPLNWTGSSNLAIENRCKSSHQFEVLPNDLPFLQILAPTHKVSVAGRKTKALPVKFNTSGIHAGEYNGQVVVRCLDCSRERGCTQDRDFVPVHIVIGEVSPTTSTHPEPKREQSPGQTKDEPPKKYCTGIVANASDGPNHCGKEDCQKEYPPGTRVSWECDGDKCPIDKDHAADRSCRMSDNTRLARGCSLTFSAVEGCS